VLEEIAAEGASNTKAEQIVAGGEVTMKVKKITAS
jgi:hypothetical protein